MRVITHLARGDTSLKKDEQYLHTIVVRYARTTVYPAFEIRSRPLIERIVTRRFHFVHAFDRLRVNCPII